MKRLILCAVALCVAGALARAADPPGPAEKGLKIGYVDINKVLDQYARRDDLDKELNGIRLAMQEKDRVGLGEIDKLSKSIEQLAMGTPERTALQEKLKAAQDALTKSRSESYEQLTKEIVSRMDSLYNEITSAVTALGKERGYDFILKDQSPASDVASRGEAAVQITQRVVLYAKPEYDLTSEVSRRLNEAYAGQKARDAGKSDKPAEPSKMK